jgi:hypothetical protein
VAPGRSARMGGRFARWNGQERAPNREPSQGSTDEVRTSLSRVRASAKPAEAEFVRRLCARGVAATVRDTRGRDIDGACGQLAASGR